MASETENTLSERLRAAIERPDDWNCADLMRSAIAAIERAAKRDQAFDLLLAYTECSRAYNCWYFDDETTPINKRDMIAVFRRHGWDGKGEWIEWLDELQSRALAAAKPHVAALEGQKP